jgi:hypothetical protein
MARSWTWSALACTAAMAGCVGKSTSGDPPDAPGGADAPKIDASMMIDAPAAFTCRNRITSGLDNGHHNPGQNCQQGCHNHNFYMSGTMYSSATGGAPVAGASITFVDAIGRTGDMQTNLNGNFWWSLEVTFPVKIIASMCPDIKPMTAMVQAAGGGCNQNGCHTAAGGAGRIHLP